MGLPGPAIAQSVFTCSGGSKSGTVEVEDGSSWVSFSYDSARGLQQFLSIGRSVAIDDVHLEGVRYIKEQLTDLDTELIGFLFDSEDCQLSNLSSLPFTSLNRSLVREADLRNNRTCQHYKHNIAASLLIYMDACETVQRQSLLEGMGAIFVTSPDPRSLNIQDDALTTVWSAGAEAGKPLSLSEYFGADAAGSALVAGLGESTEVYLAAGSYVLDNSTGEAFWQFEKQSLNALGVNLSDSLEGSVFGAESQIDYIANSNATVAASWLPAGASSTRQWPRDDGTSFEATVIPYLMLYPSSPQVTDEIRKQQAAELVRGLQSAEPASDEFLVNLLTGSDQPPQFRLSSSFPRLAYFMSLHGIGIEDLDEGVVALMVEFN